MSSGRVESSRMTRYGMVIDIDSCIGCYNCQLVCKDEHVGNDWPPYSAPQPDLGQFWLKLTEKERVFPQVVKVAYIPIPCMHCKDAPCVKAAKDGAVYARPDGIIIIDPVKARGQKQIVDSCPYGAIYWNEQTEAPEAGGLAQKCTLCAHLLDDGFKQPRCVESCPTDAMVFGDMDDPESQVSKLIKSGKTEIMKPELGLDTAVRYIGLPKPMIGGSVIFGDTDECGAGVGVTVVDEAGQTASAKTNNYGDFLVDRLVAGKKYTVRLDHPKYSSKEMQIVVDGDKSLGEIVLTKK